MCSQADWRLSPEDVVNPGVQGQPGQSRNTEKREVGAGRREKGKWKVNEGVGGKKKERRGKKREEEEVEGEIPGGLGRLLTKYKQNKTWDKGLAGWCTPVILAPEAKVRGAP